MAGERPRGDDRPRGDCVSRRAERDPATVSAPRILTFGCRLNAYESEVMRGHAAAAGLATTIIVNTCPEIGRASGRERVCQDVEISVVDVKLTKKTNIEQKLSI